MFLFFTVIISFRFSGYKATLIQQLSLEMRFILWLLMFDFICAEIQQENWLSELSCTAALQVSLRLFSKSKVEL